VAIRDNVLFEYGLFAGYLARHNAILVQIGDSEVPSDLRGIQLVRVKPCNTLAPRKLRDHMHGAAVACLHSLLRPRQEEFELVISELRNGSDYLPSGCLRPLLATAISRRVSLNKFATISAANLRNLLRKYRSSGRLVGLPKHTTRLENFIDFSRLEPEDLKKLSANFAQFAAGYLMNPCEGELCATRIALHQKDDMNFLATVLARIQIHPAIVDLKAPLYQVRGRYFRGEHAIFLHDFTTSGFTPLECINALRMRGISINRIVSFFAREETLNDLQEHCKQQNVDFRPFCIARSSGELDIAKLTS
jgi:hypothetical protein